MVAGGSDILRTPRPGEHKRRTIYERRISRRYARPRLPPTIAKPARIRRWSQPDPRPPGEGGASATSDSDGYAGAGVRGGGGARAGGAGWMASGLEVGGGADAEAGGLLVEEASRGQVLGGQAERFEHGDLVVARAARGRAGEQLTQLGPDRVDHALPLRQEEVPSLVADRLAAVRENGRLGHRRGVELPVAWQA